jgi:hypothetical protein
LPFGRYQGQPLAEVPSSYLRWCLTEVATLSHRLRHALIEELDRRDSPTPPVSLERPLRGCKRHPDAKPVITWEEDSLGRKRLRGDCSRCGRFCDFPPCVPPYTTAADAHASPTPVLDVLTQLDELGLELVSDGKAVRVAAQDVPRVPAELLRLVRQCRHELARLLRQRRT